jgi:hypothetical protein
MNSRLIVPYIYLVTLLEHLTPSSTLAISMKVLRTALVAAILLLLGIADLAVVSLFLLEK